MLKGSWVMRDCRDCDLLAVGTIMPRMRFWFLV